MLTLQGPFMYPRIYYRSFVNVLLQTHPTAKGTQIPSSLIVERNLQTASNRSFFQTE